MTMKPNRLESKASVATFALLLMFAACFANRAWAGEDYYWYDGGKKKALHMDSELVAEFNSPSDEESAVKGAEPAAKRVPVRGNIAMWRVGSSKSVVLNSASSKPGSGVSPVFHEGGPQGRIMSLPGNVLVFFKGGMTEQNVADWAASKNLEIVNKLNIGKNAYVLKTAPGLDSLTTANTLQESGEVESAQPNWWKPAQKR
jgi:hypothetical protein